MNKWYNFRFRIVMPEEKNPRRWVDIFIIDTILRKIHSEYKQKIALWRIHVETGRIEVGHQLSFSCYINSALARYTDEYIKQCYEFDLLQRHQLLRVYFCDEAVARLTRSEYEDYLEKSPQANAVLKSFQEFDEEVGLFKKFQDDKVWIFYWQMPEVKKKALGIDTVNEIMEHAGKAKPNIEATSEKDWPIELQKSWPYYINGVSEMLLDLIGQLKTQLREKTPCVSSNTTLGEVESYYNELNERLTAVWQQWGSHAFFHHINALFGYAPLIAKPRSIHGIMTTF